MSTSYPTTIVSVTIAANVAGGTWSDPIEMTPSGIDLSVTFTASSDKLTIQRYKRGAWRTVNTVSGDAELHLVSVPGVLWRIGMADGAYTAGTVSANLEGRA